MLLFNEMKIMNCTPRYCDHVLNIFINTTDTSDDNEDTQSVVSEAEENDRVKECDSELCKANILFVCTYTS